jgi:hypothetical protein
LSVLSIGTFSEFAGLLLAARKLANESDAHDRLGPLADLAAAIRDSGLAPLVAEMARRAEEVALHFTHPGPARDDAIAVFWQVAPVAFADPEAFAADLDPGVITERMVAAIRASPNARDFAATVLAEPFFRAVTRQVLGVMFASAEYNASVATSSGARPVGATASGSGASPAPTREPADISGNR